MGSRTCEMPMFPARIAVLPNQDTAVAEFRAPLVAPTLVRTGVEVGDPFGVVLISLGRASCGV